MKEILTMLGLLLSTPALLIILVCLVGLLTVLLITPIYFAVYFLDATLGNMPLKIGSWMGKKFPRVKDKALIRRCWEKIQPKSLYVRYETPLCTYCFSHVAIIYLGLIFPSNFGMVGRYFVATAMYMLCYFIGMRRKCGKQSEYYENVLQNNLEFLRLSFVPLAFLITVIGFAFTTTGSNIFQLQLDYDAVRGFLTSLLSVGNGDTILKLFSDTIVLGIGTILLLYAVSLPIQVISYYIILVIQHVRKYGKPYKIIIDTAKDIFHKLT